jgi:hypothetical protein
MSDAIITVNKTEIDSKLPAKFAFICFASYEQRSITVPLSLDNTRISKTKVFRGLRVDNGSSLKKICSGIVNSEIIDLDFDDPVRVAENLTKTVKEIYSSEGVHLVIDITTFTHEILMMFIKLIYDNRQKFSSVFCLYNGAADYSNSKESGLNQMWLSKGCRDVRNVIGYPGKISPAAKTCLILLTGFELERATRLIELLEPDKLALGIGVNPTHDNHREAMEYFHTKFSEWKENYKNSTSKEFTFSCKEVGETIMAITSLISEQPDDNYIIVPLNTKLSTVAASIVALLNKKIQICYAIPEIYNTNNYSVPSENITVMDWCKIPVLKPHL